MDKKKVQPVPPPDSLLHRLNNCVWWWRFLQKLVMNSSPCRKCHALRSVMKWLISDPEYESTQLKTSDASDNWDVSTL